jgi:hypothetical protein
MGPVVLFSQQQLVQELSDVLPNMKAMQYCVESHLAWHHA